MASVVWDLGQRCVDHLDVVSGGVRAGDSVEQHSLSRESSGLVSRWLPGWVYHGGRAAP
jgi:hypothetical protein